VPEARRPVMMAFPHGRSEGYLQDPTHVSTSGTKPMGVLRPYSPERPASILYGIYQPSPGRFCHDWNSNATAKSSSKSVPQKKYAR